MNKRKLRAGFARAAKDPEMIQLAEVGIEYTDISRIDMVKWARAFVERYRADLIARASK